MSKDKIIMYAPEGELHDSVQASGVLDISDLSRKEIKKLAKNAAGWSGENGTFSWQDVASGQADIQGKFTRHEELYKRKFNKQLKKNLHHTEQQQLLQAAKDGNPEAMGQYVASKRDDTAPIIGAVTVGPAALMAGIGTGALTGIVQGGKWLFNNPITGTTLDALGTIAGQKNFYSDNGYKKTIARAKEGDVWGAVASGAGDVLDFLGPLDLLRRGKQVVNFIENPTHTYKFKYIDDIGDGGTRWQSVNDTYVDSEFQRLKDFRYIDQSAIAKMAAENGDDVWHIVPKLTEKGVVDAYTDISNSSQLGGKEWLNKIGWTSDMTADEWIKKMDDMLNPKSSNYNPKLKDELEFWGIDPRVRSNPSMQTKKMIVDYHKTAENAKDYVQKSYTHKHKKLSNDDLNSMFDDFPEQGMTLYGENVGNSKNINDHLYIGTTPGKFEFYTKVKPEKWSDLFTKKYWKDLDLSGTTLTSVAAHETAHGNRMFNTEANIDMFTPVDKRMQILMESPQYTLNYQAVPERWKQLLKPSKYVNSHDIELSEGYSDLWGTRANMYERGIGKKASFDPNKKYNYFDLLRYKMTPTGMTDRFIIQRGGWWKGWKQQLDALNEVYKNGGKLNDR